MQKPKIENKRGKINSQARFFNVQSLGQQFYLVGATFITLQTANRIMIFVSQTEVVFTLSFSLSTFSRSQDESHNENIVGKDSWKKQFSSNNAKNLKIKCAFYILKISYLSVCLSG